MSGPSDQSLVDKAVATLTDVKTLDAKSLTGAVKVVAAELTSSPEVLKVLQEVVAKWRQETKGVVPFEVEATFELVVKQVLDGKGGDAVKTVEVASVGCLRYLASLFCRYAAAEAPKVVKEVVDAVAEVAPDAVKGAVETTGDALVAAVQAAAAVVSEEVAAAAPSAPPAEPSAPPAEPSALTAPAAEEKAAPEPKEQTTKSSQQKA